MSGARDLLTSEPILGLFTIVGGVSVLATALAQWGRYAVGLIGGRPVLRLHRGRTVDLVVTTSAFDESVLGAAIRRPSTGLGQIITIMHATRKIARLYGNQSALSFHFSRALGRHRMDRDLILVGGPAKNELSQKFLRELSLRSGVPALTFDDVEGRIGFGEHVIAKDLTGVHGDDIDEDFALIIGVGSPFDPSGKARALFISGFTSFGTAAAGEFLFEHLTDFRWRLRRVPRSRARALWPKEFAVIVRFSDPAGKAVTFEILAVADLSRSRVDWTEGWPQR